MRSIAALTLLLCGSAFSQTYLVMNLPRNTCGAYIESRKEKSPQADYVVAWAWGYMSGYNLHSGKKQVEFVGRDTISMYIDKFCRDNPLKEPSDGVFEMVNELSRKKN